MNDNRHYSIITIDPADVDISTESPLRARRHLPGEPGESESDRILVESIEMYGMMHPPIFVTGLIATSGKPVLLDGYRRIAAARELGVREIDAVHRTVEPGDHGRTVLDWLASFSFGAPLSELEMIIRLDKAYGFDIDVPLPPLPVETGKNEFFKRMRHILDLDDHTQEALHRGEVSTGDLLQLMEHPFVDANEAACMLAGERLTRSEQRKAVRLMLRIGDGGTEEWKRFVGSYTPESGALLEVLERTCHPTYTKDRGRIEEIVREMHLPPGVSIQPPENMEGGSYRLQMPIRDQETFRRALEKLQAAVDAGNVAELLEILSGGKDT